MNRRYSPMQHQWDKHCAYCKVFRQATAAPQHEIHSPWANSDQMHDVMIIQRCQRSSCFIEADLRTTLNLMSWGWSCWTLLLGLVQPSGTLCSVVLSSPLWLLDSSFSHQPLDCCLPLFPPLQSKPSSPSFLLESLIHGSWGQQNISNNCKYSYFFINLPLFFHPLLFLFLSLSVQLMAGWTLVMLVCCWLRDEAPTRWLTCESSKVSMLTCLYTKQYASVLHVSSS